MNLKIRIAALAWPILLGLLRLLRAHITLIPRLNRLTQYETQGWALLKIGFSIEFGDSGLGIGYILTEKLLLGGDPRCQNVPLLFSLYSWLAKKQTRIQEMSARFEHFLDTVSQFPRRFRAAKGKRDWCPTSHWRGIDITLPSSEKFLNVLGAEKGHRRETIAAQNGCSGDHQ